jgi:hypothetical protein
LLSAIIMLTVEKLNLLRSSGREDKTDGEDRTVL